MFPGLAFVSAKCLCSFLRPNQAHWHTGYIQLWPVRVMDIALWFWQSFPSTQVCKILSVHICRKRVLCSRIREVMQPRHQGQSELLPIGPVMIWKALLSPVYLALWFTWDFVFQVDLGWNQRLSSHGSNWQKIHPVPWGAAPSALHYSSAQKRVTYFLCGLCWFPNCSPWSLSCFWLLDQRFIFILKFFTP